VKIFLAQGIDLFFQILFWVIFVRLLLTWFPDINWYNQPFKALKETTDPILEPFRKIIPPIGGIDISPIAAVFAIDILRRIIVFIIITT